MTVFLKFTSLIALIALTGCDFFTKQQMALEQMDPVQAAPAPVQMAPVQAAPSSKTVVARAVDSSAVGTLSVSGTAANPVFNVNGAGPVNVLPQVATNQGALANSVFEMVSTANGDAFFLYGETAGGHAAVAASSNRGANSFSASTLNRTVDSELPLTGTANFSGDYVGALQSASVAGGPNDVSLGFFKGDVTLNADFAAETLEGDITNRQLLNGTAAADVNLRISTADANSVYRGVTSGGGIAVTQNAGGSTTQDGSYTAMIVGSTGQGAVGTIEIEHAGATYPNGAIEVGAFVAD